MGMMRAVHPLDLGRVRNTPAPTVTARCKVARVDATLPHPEPIKRCKFARMKTMHLLNSEAGSGALKEPTGGP